MAPKRKTKLQASVAPPPAILADETVFAAALADLSRLDADFVATTAASGAPILRRREPGFDGLASIIVAQQVSTASAAAIFSRLTSRFDGRLRADTLLAASDADLKGCGLSAPKVRTLRAIAEAIVGGSLDFDQLAVAGADEAHAMLVAIKGIGPWTADVFLLFCLGHADAWPAGDLALQEAARLALGLDQRPTRQGLIEIGERWRPLRGVAAHCLWAYYRFAKARAATLDAPAPPRKAARPRTRKT